MLKNWCRRLKKRFSLQREPFRNSWDKESFSEVNCKLAARRRVKMENRVLSRSWFSSLILYSMLIWTFICFIGTWFVIIKYEILFKGFIALVMTFFFAAVIWILLLAGLILLSLFVTPTEEPVYFVMFKELIKRGMEEHTPYVMFKELIKRGMRRSSV